MFETNGSCSKLSEDGDRVIQLDSLDSLIDSEITFLKMDIEGAEKSAIEGSKNIIGKYNPKMAISVYHRIDDFHEIPNMILNIANNYDIYLRYYTEGIDETVMFFVPKL